LGSRSPFAPINTFNPLMPDLEDSFAFADVADDAPSTREKSFAAVWSSAQHVRSRYLRSWIRCVYRYFEKWFAHRLLDLHEPRARGTAPARRDKA
jgi:hypothetical protein